jgi:RNA polymerase sigma-70 factor (ECF subfamily)
MDETKWAIAREIPHLRRYARSLTGDRDAADDLVQDCLERGLRKRHLWHGRGSLRSWLFRILYTTFLNGRQKQRRSPAEVDVEAMTDPTPAAPSQETAVHAGDVVAGLNRLPDDQRAAILLIALEGMSYDEAARVLGIPIGTLRSRLWRGRAALRELEPVSIGHRTKLRRVK